MSIRALVIKPLLEDASVLVFGDGDGLSWPFGGMAHQKFRHVTMLSPGLVHTRLHNELERSTMLFMGKSTISPC